MAGPVVWVVIVSYNSGQHLPGLLESLKAEAAAGTGRFRLRVVVVDNDSTDDSAEVAAAAGVEVVRTGRNGGYSAGINAGRRYLRSQPRPTKDPAGHDGEYVLIANPDLRFESGAVGALLGAAQRLGGVVAPRISAPGGATRRSLFREPTIARQIGEAVLGDHWGRRPGWLAEIVRDPNEYRIEHTVDWATGAVLMVPWACDEAVGDWDESFFLFSEEVDFASRVRSAGYVTTFVPEAAAMHSEGGSGRPPALMRLIATNKIRYYRARHGRLSTFVYALAVLLQLVLRAGDEGHRQALRPVAVTSATLVLAAAERP